ncbi:hypothetical protein BJX62DRAFT_244898 [Aspergillus germanicus]
MTPKILVVFTSAATSPANGQETGWHLPELAHPWDLLHPRAEIVVASPKGGVAPISKQSVGLHANDSDHQ